MSLLAQSQDGNLTQGQKSKLTTVIAERVEIGDGSDNISKEEAS